MKILHIIPYFYPAWAYGGTPRVVFDLCKELVKQGHDVTVYTTDTFDRNNRIQHETRNPKPETPFSASYFDDVVDGIRIRYFRNLSNRLAFTQKIFLTPGLMLRINQGLEGVDVVHLQEYRTLQNISAWQACRKKGIPYVVSAHGAMLRIMGREGRKGLFDSMWGYKILRDANKLVALTELEKRQYEEFGIAGEKIEVIPNGIDLTQFASLPEKGSFRAKYGLDTCPIILFLGRIHRIKGLDILIDVFAELRKDGIECKLIIAGPDDGFKKSCKLQVASCRLKQIDLSEGKKIDREDVKKADVIFMGMVSGEEKFSLYVDVDVTVLPSRFENFPSVPFESLICGTPVVVSEACGVAGMIKNAGAGYIAKAEDMGDLKEKIREVLDNMEKARLSVEKGQELVKDQLNWCTIAQKMLQVYKGC